MYGWSSQSEAESDQFFPITDLMTGLVAVFMCSSVLFVLFAYKESDSITMGQMDLLEQIQGEIQHDLKGWKAEFKLEEGLIRFDATFKKNETLPSEEFEAILEDFCPKLKQIIEPRLSLIQEIRIEGHTDDDWPEKEKAYIENMAFSQQRAINTMRHCLNTSLMSVEMRFRNLFTSVGMSFKNPITYADGRMNKTKSRRVEFVFVFKEDQSLKKFFLQYQEQGHDSL